MKRLIQENIFVSALCAFFVVAGFFGTPTTYAAVNSDINAGIATGAWLSQLPIFVDDEFEIKTAFQNNAGFDIYARATFFANNAELDSEDFRVRDGALVEISHRTKGEYGNHQFSIDIDVYKLADNSSEEDANVQLDGDLLFSQTANTLEIFIDNDNDNDGVGDEEDDDDDNDGIPDTEDEDPLNPPVDPADQAINNITENTTVVIENVNSFGEGVHNSLQARADAVRAEITALEEREEKIRSYKISGDELVVLTAEQDEELKDIVFQKNLKYGQLAALNTTATVFANPWLFWLGILIILYLIYKFLRKIFGRDSRRSRRNKRKSFDD
jgi:hypothetical protein